MTPITVATLAAFFLGIGGYYLAQRSIAKRKVAAGFLPEATGDFVEENAREENYHTLNYLLSGFLMVLVAVLTFSLVQPLGWFDHYSLLIDAGIILFFATGLSLTWIDLETKILPTSIMQWGCGASLLLFIGAAATRTGGWELLIPMLFGGVFYMLFYGLIWFWAPSAFGFGDVRLSFFIGAFLAFLSPAAAVAGFVAPWLLALLGILIGAIFGMIDKKAHIAFGPWMILGALVALFWGSPIVAMLIP